MATLLQEKHVAYAGATFGAVTFDDPLTPGSTLVVIATNELDSGTIATTDADDPDGSEWTEDEKGQGAASGGLGAGSVVVTRRPNTLSTSALAITATSAGSTSGVVHAFEYEDLDASPVGDHGNDNRAGAGSTPIVNLDMVGTGSVIVAGYAGYPIPDAGSGSPDSGFTGGVADVGFQAVHQVEHKDNAGAAATDYDIKFNAPTGVPNGWCIAAVEYKAGIPRTATNGGALGDGATSNQVVTGGQVLTVAIAGDTLLAAGGAFDGSRAALRDGHVSDGAESGGWNAQVIPLIDVSDITRVDSTHYQMVLPAVPGYEITAPETITNIVPGSALTSGLPITATPDYTITVSVAGGGGGGGDMNGGMQT